MNKQKSFITLILSIGLFLFLAKSNGYAEALEEKARYIQLSDDWVEGEEEAEEISLHMSSNDRTLVGMIDQVQYYINIPPKGVQSDSTLSLEVEYSELLLPSSSLTILWDGQPIKSIFLDHEEPAMNIDIPLVKEVLTPGVHEITIEFFGHVTENLCEFDHSGNWLTILSSSALNFTLGDETVEDALDLYPYPFIQPEREQAAHVTIVIPEGPSENILLSALQLSSSLEQQTNEEEIPILKENELETIDSHIIAVGTREQWQGIVAEIFTEAQLQTKENELLLSNVFLQFSSIDKQFLFVTGEEDHVIKERIHMLIEPSLREQLSGFSLAIDQLPKIRGQELKAETTFKEMNIPNLTLSGTNQLSQSYFHPLPMYIQDEKPATLHMKINFAKTLLESSEEINVHKKKGELVIYVNDIPHSISLSDLKPNPGKEYHEIDLPLETRFLKNDRYLSLQFEGNGLKNHEICRPPNDDDWIFIHEDSFITFPLDQPKDEEYFTYFPAPFITEDISETTLIVPKTWTEQALESLQSFVHSLGNGGTLRGLELVYAENVDEKRLENRHVILLGHIEHVPILRKYMDQLTVSVDEHNVLQVSEFGFLQETASHLSWIQSSLWDDDRVMAVISPISLDEEFSSPEQIYEYLLMNQRVAKIVVENKKGEIFTDHLQHEEKKNDFFLPQTTTDETQEVPLYVIIGFFIVFILGISVFFLFLRTRRKDS